MRRVMVIGCGGAGKSTLSRKLSGLTGLPLIGLDRAHWRPGWVVPPEEEWRARIETLAAEAAWVMDGNYSNTFDLRMPRADTVIWLDYPRATCLRRVVLRVLKDYGRVRADLPEGCPEQFDAIFLRFVWDFPTKGRPRIVEALERFGAHLRVIRLANDRDVAAFLRAEEAA